MDEDPPLRGYGLEHTHAEPNFCASYGNQTKIIFGTVTPENVLGVLAEKTDFFRTDFPALDKEKHDTPYTGVGDYRDSDHIAAGDYRDTDRDDSHTAPVPDWSAHPAVEFVVLDIDSWEYGILKALVASKIRVLVYQIEMASMFPPPFKYGLEFDEEGFHKRRPRRPEVRAGTGSPEMA